jgi:hypothetical protein
MLGMYERAQPGSAAEAAQFLQRNFKAAGAVALIVLPDGGIRASFSGNASLLPQVPNLLRQYAADYEAQISLTGTPV